MNFCHLHLHNEYSVLDGYGTADQFAARAAEIGFNYIGLSNHGNIDGVIQWQEACLKHGLKPVLGCELYIVEDALIKEKGEKRNHITVFIKNREGFHNLNQILSYANLEGFYHRPRADWDFLCSHLEGLVILTGCMDSILGDIERGRKFFDKLYNSITDKSDLYLEVMPHKLEGQVRLNKNIKAIRSKYDLRLVATNDCHYIRSNDYEIQEVLLAIQSKAKWSDEKRFKFNIKNLYLRTANQMTAAFKKQGILSPKEISSALKSTIDIAEKCCEFRIKKQKVKLPPVSLPDAMDEGEALWQLCQDGLKKKKLSKNKAYRVRLKEEMALITKKDFIRYFLIVCDLVGFCRKNNIMVGPGRGSVGGSLIAYLTEITNIDPIKYGLLFSRFIAEDRNDYPDIDLDFEDTKRDQVRLYLEDKYGSDKVVGITTAMRMKTRNALRDVSRVFEVPPAEVGILSKAIDHMSYGQDDITIEDVLKIDEGVRFHRKFPEIINYTKALEGQVRAYGQHAAALVLSPIGITKGTRGHLVRRQNNLLINWDMEDAEKMGLLKIDILSLNTLTILNGVKELVGDKLDFEKIDLEDKNLFNLINAGETTGLFQINTNFSSRICKEIVIEEFEHLYAAVALARPGPYDSGMTADYIRRKHRGHWHKKGIIYEDITAETFGVIVYQEQVMAAISRLAGMSYSDADRIRKVIGKKRDVKYFAPYKAAFIEGCLELKTMSKKEALTFWSGLEKHAHYSFNKSHSVAYAMIAMWAAHCKYYYPAEFIAASLSYMGDNKPEQKTALINEAVRNRLQVILPKAGKSHPTKWVVEESRLYIPFLEIKGVGPKGAEKLSEAPYLSKIGKEENFFDLKGEDNFVPKTREQKLLAAVGGYTDSEEIPEGAGDYFDFELAGNFHRRYPRLVDLYGGDIFQPDSVHALKGRFYKDGIIGRASYGGDKVKSCKACSLRSECRLPVPSDSGKYNIAIVLEAPGRLEDKRGRPAVGRAGNALWSELRKYNLHRSMFHVTNVNKCFPSRSRTPNKEQVKICGSKWLTEELKSIDCRLVLACGNNSLRFFTGQEGGIRKISGEVIWYDDLGLWATYCVHPSSVLRARSQNAEYFERGIKTFADIVKRFIGTKKKRRTK